MLQSTKLNLNLNIIIFRKPKMSSHDNKGGWVMNILLKRFNSSLCCKRRIDNHLHLHGLDPSSFSPFPVYKLLVTWDGYGIHHEPPPPEEGHLSSNREGSPRPRQNLWRRKPLLQVDLQTPTSSVSCAEVLSPDYILELSRSLKNKQKTPKKQK